jgi:hypothetical protein
MAADADKDILTRISLSFGRHSWAPGLKLRLKLGSEHVLPHHYHLA